MCCFTGPVSRVDNTRIFARWLPGSKPPEQFIVYQMDFKASQDLAMVLPLPIVPGSGEKAVTFLDLEKEPEFFNKLKQLFPVNWFPLAPAPEARRFTGEPKALEVVKVGSFDASFVPTQAEFARLDSRFRFPEKVWKQLPQYKDWGFAVFKLRKDSTTVHPMAFRFPNAKPEAGLFYPTVHIHDGKVHSEEEFDHTLYCQIPSGRRAPSGWDESEKLPSSLGKLEDAGILDREAHLHRRSLIGTLPNRDTWA